MSKESDDNISYAKFIQIQEQGKLSGKLDTLSVEVIRRLEALEIRVGTLENSTVKQGIYITIVVGVLLFVANNVLPDAITEFVKHGGGQK